MRFYLCSESFFYFFYPFIKYFSFIFFIYLVVVQHLAKQIFKQANLIRKSLL